MKKLSSIRVLFYCLWLIVALVQASFTELFDDEAYYWVYSKFLDWGYFDHPPMVALMIRGGALFFSGELGVRFITVLMGTASIFIIEKLTRPHDPKLFYAIILQVAVLQIGNIIAVPDIPLLFFTALFFLYYESFSTKTNWFNSIALAVIIALLLYSKYHGLLIIIATLLSNWRLLQKSTTWFVIILSAVLFLPHIFWQFNHGLPSFNYHLFERVSPPYSFSFTTDYIGGQLLFAGPFIGWLILLGAIRHKPMDLMQKAMKWSLVFVYVVFFISSFNSRTEANWTVPLFVPLIVLGYNHIARHDKLKKWVYRLLPFSLVLVLFIRVFMFLETPIIKNLPKDEFHYNKEWTKTVRNQAQGLPVVFTNSYQRASKYWFYTGDTAFSLNTHLYRRSNYNFWPLEIQLQNKNVFIVGARGAAGLAKNLESGNKKFSVDTIQDFSSFSQIILSQSDVLFDKVDFSIASTVKVDAPSLNILHYAYEQNPEIILIVYPGNKQQPILVNTGVHLNNLNRSSISLKVKLPVLDRKIYQFRWGLKGSYVEPTINSSVYKVAID